MKKKKKDAVIPAKAGIQSSAGRAGWVVLALGIVYVLSSLYLPRDRSLHLREFGELPVLNGGRLKPIDTLARSSLLILSGKQSVRHEKEKIPAVRWFLEMVFQPMLADERPVFRIDDPDVLGVMGIQQTKKRYFSFADLNPYFQIIDDQAQQASQMKTENRSRFQSAIMNLQNQIFLYHKIQNTLDQAGRENALAHLEHTYKEMKGLMAAHMQGQSHLGSEGLKRFSEFINEYGQLNQNAEFFPLPALSKEGAQLIWISPGQAMLQSVSGPWIHPGLVAYASLGDGVRADDHSQFNLALSNYVNWIESTAPSVLRRSRIEYRFNHAATFYHSMILYLAAFLLVMVSWLTGRISLQKSGYWLMLLAIVVHTVGLFLRIALQGRPPVTNLYSSAIFVGWVAVLLGIFLERLSRRGIGTVVSSLIGFVTLIIAHNLAAQGDTMEMMRAVLDSNFWLATHVVAITIGYGSTFLSGTLGIVYIVRKAFDRSWNEETAATLERMAYGVVCFSLLFSFTGTILGGIWADQSWGRFWGWDPKENGALMIVLWNAFILHARWSKVAAERGIMAMTVFGNIVTALSWFGVNMLGIGLHSYGFMEKAFFWLMVFVATQALLIGLAYVRRPAELKKAIPKN